ncbi:hypothetical protein Q4I30_002426 [Leishmania utingensis]|uniref:Uncharacterized protein n=1 Tax=Leishmania utingensis TaxID=653362 RepID=A0AAW3APA5_9TRYP
MTRTFVASTSPRRLCRSTRSSTHTATTRSRCRRARSACRRVATQPYPATPTAAFVLTQSICSTAFVGITSAIRLTGPKQRPSIYASPLRHSRSCISSPYSTSVSQTAARACSFKRTGRLLLRCSTTSSTGGSASPRQSCAMTQRTTRWADCAAPGQPIHSQRWRIYTSTFARVAASSTSTLSGMPLPLTSTRLSSCRYLAELITRLARGGRGGNVAGEPRGRQVLSLCST